MSEKKENGEKKLVSEKMPFELGATEMNALAMASKWNMEVMDKVVKRLYEISAELVAKGCTVAEIQDATYEEHSSAWELFLLPIPMTQQDCAAILRLASERVPAYAAEMLSVGGWKDETGKVSIGALCGYLVAILFAKLKDELDAVEEVEKILKLMRKEPVQ